MKWAYLVLGPESSGTKLTTQVLVQEGGAYGSYIHGQPLTDTGDPHTLRIPDGLDPLVIRRSVPHGVHWVKPDKLVKQLRNAGFEVVVVVTSRDWHASARSQTRRHYVKNEAHGLENIQKAFRTIFEGVIKSNVRFMFSHYERLAHFAYRRWLLKRLGLGVPETECLTVTDENRKYYS